MKFAKILLSAGAALTLAACSPKSDTPAAASEAQADSSAAVKLLNVSYDVARDFYKEYNPLFIKEYQAKHDGTGISIQQSHGGSSKQALSVANGLAADVVTMNQTSDIELLEKKGLVKADWQQRLPDNAIPFTSTTVFLVRKGNPKQIQDWSDLAKDGVQIVLANPKTTGNGRYAFLGAYGYGLKANNGDETQAQNFAAALLKNAPTFENGGRAATTTFTQRNIGDVLITFENEANFVSKHLTKDQFDIVYPSYTVVSQSPVAVVDSVVEKKGTQAAAEEYLSYLWSEPAQELAAKLYLRPKNNDVLAKHQADFPNIETFDPNEKFGTWEEIMKTFFADGGLVDQLSNKK
ncbi:sulfate ABC transporter substrate-binding protein [Neisseria sp. ZJ106]|uniref:Sulfate ABC transporter substrate-binding protein n=1 Tax=Neisseria lisongii TaxID=2912188 RepID=A0ABY7RKG6_9NEIS|nr:sulfate ABC transporter substrate-binding protein [Neisseria lisongii]MCF7521331.1 sulfate ABC transporter substrate-binding protein [Neisseria lisongii]WCL72135.1 sulfate ABC transporter substrate-binding protein [Neisseria lisongii]